MNMLRQRHRKGDVNLISGLSTRTIDASRQTTVADVGGPRAPRETIEAVQSKRPQELVTALDSLRRADPVLARVIDENPVFDPEAWIRTLPKLDLFGALVFEVIGQQISVVAATAIFRRLLEHFGNAVPDAQELATIDVDVLRELGLSRQKARTIRELAESFRHGRLSEPELRTLSDDAAIARLTEVKGVGPWTAQGALLIVYRRPDLIRTNDIALRRAIELQYGLDRLPSPDEVANLARRWIPHRSLASSLLLSAFGVGAGNAERTKQGACE
jgi:DNA-3-methyladenine glycosylase II